MVPFFITYRTVKSTLYLARTSESNPRHWVTFEWKVNHATVSQHRSKRDKRRFLPFPPSLFFSIVLNFIEVSYHEPGSCSSQARPGKTFPNIFTALNDRITINKCQESLASFNCCFYINHTLIRVKNLDIDRIQKKRASSPLRHFGSTVNNLL